MNFFEHQRRAKRNTVYLVFLYIVAVLAVSVAANFAATAGLYYFGNDRGANSSTTRTTMPSPKPSDLNSHHFTTANMSPFWQLFIILGVFIIPLNFLIIAMVSIFKVISLGRNGADVAKHLGAKKLKLDTNDERVIQFRNVVEEMSIASGVPMPELFILPDGVGINAFAAGTKPSNAAIGVTRGALEHLNRDELQGVIAHEFSHILNGDMRLNLNLLGILSGILALATIGRFILHGSSRSTSRSSSGRKGAAPGIAIGLGLFIVGYIGVFFAEMIKAAVSRQREFLADAAAVQFTRNPDGIGGALAKIKEFSSEVGSIAAENASHFFFGPMDVFSFFHTHPPIDERLKRINYNPLTKQAREKNTETQKSETQPQAQSSLNIESSATKNPSNAVARLGKPTPNDVLIATTIVQGLHSSLGEKMYDPRLSGHMLLALLAKNNKDQTTLAKLDSQAVRAVESVTEDKFLFFIDLAVPTLRSLDASQAATFYSLAEEYAFKDNKLKPLELAMLSILRRHLNLNGEKRSARYRTEEIQNDLLQIMKLLAKSVVTSTEVQQKEAYSQGVKLLAMDPTKAAAVWAAPDPIPRAVDASLRRLGQLIPAAHEKVFSAFFAVARHDQRVSATDTQTLRALAEVMEIPMPPTT